MYASSRTHLFSFIWIGHNTPSSQDARNFLTLRVSEDFKRSRMSRIGWGYPMESTRLNSAGAAEDQRRKYPLGPRQKAAAPAVAPAVIIKPYDRVFTRSGSSSLNVRTDSTGTLILPLVRTWVTAPAAAPEPAPIAAPLPPPVIAPMIAPMAAPPPANSPVRRLTPRPECPFSVKSAVLSGYCRPSIATVARSSTRSEAPRIFPPFDTERITICALAPAGITTLPSPSSTSLVTSAENVWPSAALLESMVSSFRTEISVPAANWCVLVVMAVSWGW